MQALTSLGQLKVEATAPTVLRELRDDNPAIVREAARALEQILGVRVAVARMVESASSDRDLVTGSAAALRWMDRDAVVRELEAVMMSGAPDAQEAAGNILSEIGGISAFEILRARKDASKRYLDVLQVAEDGVRAQFNDSIREARTGFKFATGMDLVVFFLGVGLLAWSAGVVLANDGTLDSWAGVGLTGSIGVLGVVYGTLIANPRRKVEQAVDHLMFLKVVFLSYLRQLHQVDQAYTQRMLENEPMDAEQLKQFSIMVRTIMSSSINILSRTEMENGKRAVTRDDAHPGSTGFPDPASLQ